jgi:hypothetical protein
MPRRGSRAKVIAGCLFPPLSGNSPVAFGDAADVKRYVSPVNTGKLNATSRYEPLSSIWEGSDGALLEEMFKFYAAIPRRAGSWQ